jgi:hypothetical protein
MQQRKKFLTLILVLLIFNFVLPEKADAIPAFARRYKISCSTCHAPIPKLKPYGDEFAGNGFIIPEEEKERDYISAGDNMLWVNRTFPVAVRFDAYTVFDEKKEVDNDLQIPWGLKLLSGGALYKNIGYYFYFYMSERGEVAGIEDAYIHFNNVFNSELDIMVGQFQTSDPLMKRELRLTYEDYMIYKTKIGNSNTNLTYDRGIMLVYGIPQTGTDLVGLIVNGNGKDMADEDTHKFDKDSFKNIGFRVNQGIGEWGSIGAYFYLGKEKSFGLENKITYWGPDLNFSVGPLEFTGQYLKRTDDNPFFRFSADEIDTQGIIAELVYSPKLDKSRIYFTGLYNQVDSDLNSADYETLSLSATYLVARNLRLMGEYTRDILYDTNMLTFGIVSGF